MTNASWKLTNWLCEYAQLMRALRTEAGCVFGGLCQLFELYLLHIFHTFSDTSLAELSSPNRQQQVQFTDSCPQTHAVSLTRRMGC